MHPEARATLQTALEKTIAALLAMPPQLETRRIWKRDGPGAWTTGLLTYSSMDPAFREHKLNWDELGAVFVSAFSRHHADHTEMVGVADCASGLTPMMLFHRIVSHVWHRHVRNVNPTPLITATVEEVAQFVDEPTVPVRCVSHALNLELVDVDRVILPDGLEIRPMTDDELTAAYGGDSAMPFDYTPRPTWIFDNAIVTTMALPKILSKSELDGKSQLSVYMNQVRRLLLAMRVLKSGRVGILGTRITPLRFFPYTFQPRHSSHETPEFGGYSLTASEAEALRQIYKNVSGQLDGALDIACSRLSDAEKRLMPRDRLMDAVIGLESILLANLAKEDRRGELRFRFSLHYSSLFEGADPRYREFRIARDLYDLRSMIAHGGHLTDDKFRLGEERVSLAVAADRACEALRSTIHRFLPECGSPRYRRDGFWEQAYFAHSTNEACP